MLIVYLTKYVEINLYMWPKLYLYCFPDARQYITLHIKHVFFFTI